MFTCKNKTKTWKHRCYQLAFKNGESVFIFSLIWGLENGLVSWYFEPSWPQRIISGLKTNFSLSPSYSARKSSSHKFFQIYKVSPDTNLNTRKHTYTNIKLNNFWRISPFGTAPVKKAHKARTHWYHGSFCRLINTHGFARLINTHGCASLNC